MEIRGATEAALSGVQSVASGDASRMKLQMALLKKTLEMQQEQATQLQKLAEGKGQLIDIRA